MVFTWPWTNKQGKQEAAVSRPASAANGNGGYNDAAAQEWLRGVRERLIHTLFYNRVNFRFLEGAGSGTLAHRYAILFGTQTMNTRYEQVKALEATLAQRAGVEQLTVSRQGALIAFTMSLPVVYQRDCLFPTKALPTFRPLNILLGVAEDRTWKSLHLNETSVPHVLIAGTTGCGKTELARCMIASLAIATPPKDIALVLLDPAGKFSDFADLPHTHITVNTLADCVTALHWLHDRVNARQEGKEENGLPVVAFIDELAQIATADREAIPFLSTLMAGGRQCGIHVVAGTQHPLASVIGPLVKANLPCRVVGKVTEASIAAIASGRRETGAESLTGRGEFLLLAGGEVLRVQGAWLTAERWALWRGKLLHGVEYPRRPLPDFQPQAVVEPAPVERKVTDDEIRQAWRAKQYAGRLIKTQADLEFALFGYNGGAAARRVKLALDGTTTTRPRIFTFPGAGGDRLPS